MAPVVATLVVDPRLMQYDFGPGHPLGSIRIALTYEQMRASGILASDTVRVIEVDTAISDEQLLRVHRADYVDLVRHGSVTPDFFSLPHGIGTGDVPRFDNMHEASVRVCSATMAAALAVAEGESEHALNIAGGLHHAMPDHAAGFCVYNDVAVAIAELLAQGYERIAYVDVDAHHGDGVERAFWDDPRVLTVSIHQSGRTLFPHSGFPEQTGGERARGYAVNLGLPPHTGDAEWLRAFSAVVPELLEEFAPQVLISQHGCDGHRLDPLTSLELSVDGQRRSYQLLHEWAHAFAGGNWIAVGGGGYALTEVVPRIWTHLAAIVSHQEHLVDFTDDVRPQWRSFHTGWDPHSEIDRAIMATRRAVFPLHGLVVDPASGF